MSVAVEQPIWLRRVTQPGAAVFALMFALESLSRSTLAALIPLQAYAILKEARDVSLTYFCVSITGFCASFVIPLLIRRFRRRWVYTAGVVMLILCAGALATATLTGQIVAMVLRSLAAASLNITLSLYTLDYIRKRDLVRSEPFKAMMSAASWTMGPALGVYLYSEVGHGTAELLSASAAAALLCYFWYLRMQENPAVAAATRPAPNPFLNVRRLCCSRACASAGSSPSAAPAGGRCSSSIPRSTWSRAARASLPAPCCSPSAMRCCSGRPISASSRGPAA